MSGRLAAGRLLTDGPTDGRLPDELMRRVVGDLRVVDLLAVGLGGALLLFGRRLYWLALAAGGFVVGLGVAERVFETHDQLMQIGVGVLLGILGAVLAIVAQEVAIMIAGFFIGGLGTLWLILTLVEKPDVTMWLVVVVGAIVGVVMAKKLFEAALIVVSAIVGATLLVQALALQPPHNAWVFVALVAVGVMAQARGEKKRVVARRADD